MKFEKIIVGLSFEGYKSLKFSRHRSLRNSKLVMLNFGKYLVLNSIFVNIESPKI